MTAVTSLTPDAVAVRPVSASTDQVPATGANRVQPVADREAVKTGLTTCPAWDATRTGVAPAKARLTKATWGHGSATFTSGPAPSRTSSGPPPAAASSTVQIWWSGPIPAATIDPKLGASPTSTAAWRLPPAPTVASAIRPPRGPCVEPGLVSWNQTRVTAPLGEASTRRAAAEDGPRESIVRTPPAQLRPPAGTEHRWTSRPGADVLAEIQPTKVVPAAVVATS